VVEEWSPYVDQQEYGGGGSTTSVLHAPSADLQSPTDWADWVEITSDKLSTL